MNIAIIGCGHGGQALAADLTRRGFAISLYAHPDHTGGIRAISKQGGIICKGLMKGFIPISQTTTCLQQAVKNTDYIFIALPSHAHETLFTDLLPYLRAKQTIITLAANFASLRYLKLLKKAAKKNIDLIDIASLPYVCRADNKGVVEIISIKNKLAAASIPASAMKQHLQALSSILPCLITGYQDVLSLNMNITSGLTHPAITLLNAGRIGHGKKVFYFYREGITPAIAAMIEKLDSERLHIGRQLGLTMHGYLDLMAEYYGKRYTSIYEFFRQSPAHNAMPFCPASLQERYITQDVAGLLVPWYCLGKTIKYEPRVMGNFIHLASLINNTAYLKTGTNLISLGLHNKTVDEIKHYVHTGNFPSAHERNVA